MSRLSLQVYCGTARRDVQRPIDRLDHVSRVIIVSRRHVLPLSIRHEKGKEAPLPSREELLLAVFTQRADPLIVHRPRSDYAEVGPAVAVDICEMSQTSYRRGRLNIIVLMRHASREIAAASGTRSIRALRVHSRTCSTSGGETAGEKRSPARAPISHRWRFTFFKKSVPDNNSSSAIDFNPATARIRLRDESRKQTILDSLF